MQLDTRAHCKNIGFKKITHDYHDTKDHLDIFTQDVWSNMSGSSYHVQKRQWEALALVAGGSDGNVGQ